MFKWFGKTSTDDPTGATTSDACSGIEALNGTSDVIFLCLPPPFEHGLDPNVRQEDMIAAIRAFAEDLSDRQSFSPFTYESPSGRVLPLFTDDEHAELFVRAYVAKVGRIMPFQVLSVSGPMVARLLEAGDVVILNPDSPASCTISGDDLRRLRSSVLKS